MKLISNQHLPYGLIHELKLVELKTLKTYIKTNLANCLIMSFNSSITTLILFVKKSNKSF